jgi:polysaccharide biosynthesis/export protein
VSLKSIMQAANPEENILIRPNDVISVPRADLVYVIGEVKKPGGFMLQERGTISGLQALAMADGLTPIAAPQKAVIIRQSAGGPRIQIPANLKDILSGKMSDVEILPDDILFIPTNVARNAVVKSIQTAVSAATSAVIYRGIY